MVSQGHLFGSYVARVLHIAGISNVDSVLLLTLMLRLAGWLLCFRSCPIFVSLLFVLQRTGSLVCLVSLC